MRVYSWMFRLLMSVVRLGCALQRCIITRAELSVGAGGGISARIYRQKYAFNMLDGS